MAVATPTILTATPNDEVPPPLGWRYAILANQLRGAGHRKTSIAVARRAFRIAPDAEVMQQLGSLLLRDHQPLAALHYVIEAGKRAPDLAETTAFCVGLAYLYMGNNKAALDELRKVADTDLEAAFAYAHCLLVMGRWKEGFEALECGRLRDPEVFRAKNCRIWNGEKIGTLWVTMEQGIGDALMFSRFLPWARSRCDRLIFSSRASTINLFEDYPGVDELRFFAPSIPEPEADAHALLMSLPYFYNLTPKTIPPDPGHFRKIAERVGANLTADPGMRKIGLVWAGNQRQTRDWERTVPLEEFLPLVENPNLQLISLQVGERAKDLDTFGLRQIITDFSDKLTAWPITASVLCGLDALVTCDTGVAHLAGALGVPTYLLLCKRADWRWLQRRSTTPWYPSVKIIRQERLGNWTSCVTAVERMLDS